jgi:hypothetical protein
MPDFQTIKTKYMKRKKIILLVLFLVFAGGTLYGYAEYTRKVKDLSKVKAQVNMKAAELIAAFEKNEAEANASYLDKIIAVKGKVKQVEKNDMGFLSIVIGDEESMSSVRCSVDPGHQEEMEKIMTGDVITVKGACTGFNADELLGSDVILNRCVLTK